jgi:hypothetical protein
MHIEFLSETAKGRGLLERPGCGWDDAIKMHLIGIGYEGVDWFHLLQDVYQFAAPVNTEKILRVE